MLQPGWHYLKHKELKALPLKTHRRHQCYQSNTCTYFHGLCSQRYRLLIIYKSLLTGAGWPAHILPSVGFPGSLWPLPLPEDFPLAALTWNNHACNTWKTALPFSQAASLDYPESPHLSKHPDSWLHIGYSFSFFFSHRIDNMCRESLYLPCSLLHFSSQEQCLAHNRDSNICQIHE